MTRVDIPTKKQIQPYPRFGLPKNELHRHLQHMPHVKMRALLGYEGKRACGQGLLSAHVVCVTDDGHQVKVLGLVTDDVHQLQLADEGTRHEN